MNIHPKDKVTVGHRLALIVRANANHEEDLVFSGPVHKKMTVDENAIVLEFDHQGSGLMAGEKLPWTAAGKGVRIRLDTAHNQSKVPCRVM